MSANRAKGSREALRRKRRERTKENLEFYECIRDIVSHPAVLEMKKFYQHCDTDCYEHCLDVAYNNYKICFCMTGENTGKRRVTDCTPSPIRSLPIGMPANIFI